MKRICLFVSRAAVLALIAAACACSPETAIQEVLESSTEALVFFACKAVSTREISFRFSLPVKVSTLNFDPPAEVESITDGKTVAVLLKEPLAGGRQVTADLLVEDGKGNTLNVLVPFRARNEEMPPLLITEIRTEYSKPKVEFVELRTLEAGNLGALRLFIAGAGMDIPLFEFPPVNVQAGEYIVVHLRNLYEGIDETGDNLGANVYTKENEALLEARDFWAPGTKKNIKKTDAVFLMDQDDKVVDAALLSENPDTWWKDEKLAQAAKLLAAQGAWVSPNDQIPGPADAVPTANTTATRSICRDEAGPDTNTAADWYITASSGSTPGKVNSTKKYVPRE